PEGQCVLDTRFRVRSYRLVGLAAAVLATVVFTGEGQSRQQDNKPGKKAANQAQKAANQKENLKESEALKAAFILMAMANHDYAGHRAKAMHHVEAAIKALDASVLKNGTSGQMVVALKEEITAARAQFAAQHSTGVHESQAVSDLQMREAHQLLVKV